MSIKKTIQKTKLKPAKDVIVLDPLTGEPLPEKGKAVVLDKYWRRRIQDGDVEIILKENLTTKAPRTPRNIN